MTTITLNLVRLVRQLAASWLIGLALIAASPALVHAKNACTANTAVHADVAAKIAHGHAFTKHSDEFVHGVIINGLAFPDPTLESADDFAGFLTKILDNPTVSRGLANSRTAHWDARTGTVIIYNPLPEDCGTAFRPYDGKTYFDDLK
ncbi:hypothetical protein ACQKGC_10980 [Allorhizobium pseudoryzae]|uniref:hypothetical protein n=1 Tax=Allorhizobium pseudoryzae TaxID=379684 RepID=UPI003CFCFB63